MKRLNSITAGGVILIALLAFTLSYSNMVVFAQANHVEGNLAYLFPLVVDGFVIIAILAVLRGAILGEGTSFPWSLVLTFTGLSILFNVWGKTTTWVGVIAAAVPPVALFLATELFTAMLKSDAKRNGTLAGLGGQIQSAKATLADIADKLANAETALADTECKLADKRKALADIEASIEDVPALDMRRGQVRALSIANMPADAMAEALGVSVKTIKRDLKALNGQAAC